MDQNHYIEKKSYIHKYAAKKIICIITIVNSTKPQHMCAVLVPASTKIPPKKRHYDATRSTYELLLLSSMYIHTPLTKNGFESSYPRLHANPNPSLPSRIAVNNFSFISSSDEYSGRSNWLKQVCAEGKR